MHIKYCIVYIAIFRYKCIHSLFTERLSFYIAICREKDIHGRHLKQLEEEMEVQIQKAEMRIRKDVSTAVCSAATRGRSAAIVCMYMCVSMHEHAQIVAQIAHRSFSL